MRAWTQKRYGGPEVLELGELPRPVLKDDEVLVRMLASTVTSGDARIRAFDVPGMVWLPARLALGLTRPRNPVRGTEFAGEVVEVGRAVTRWHVGDRVFGLTVNGSHAEFKRVKASSAMALIPDGLSFEDAAALPFAGMSALHFLDVGQVGAGTKLLINGAAGAVGSAAVQIAVARGAEVTAVCSGANRELVTALGAGRVIDYRTQLIFAPGDAYDVVFDTQGRITPNQAGPAMVAGGRFIALVMRMTDLTQRPKGIKVIGGVAASNAAQMAAICRLVEQGALKPVIDEVFAFEQMPAAHARVDSGHKRGSVVVKIAP